MTAAFYAVVAYIDWISPPLVRASWPAPAVDPAMLKAIGLIMIELMLVTAVAVMFSTFSSPFLSAVLTVGLWVIGQFGQDLRAFGAVVDSPAAASIARGLSYVLPDFASFDVKAQVVHGQPVPMAYVALTSAYGVVYLALLLTAAVVIFSRRDFK